MKRIDKPWGHELIWASTESYVGKRIFIKGGRRLSMQYHEIKEESIYVISGSMLLELDGNTENKSVIELNVGDSYHITPKTVHRMVALKDVSIIEVSTTELNDVVRIEDDYGRAGTSEEYED